MVIASPFRKFKNFDIWVFNGFAKHFTINVAIFIIAHFSMCLFIMNNKFMEGYFDANPFINLFLLIEAKDIAPIDAIVVCIGLLYWIMANVIMFWGLSCIPEFWVRIRFGTSKTFRSILKYYIVASEKNRKWIEKYYIPYNASYDFLRICSPRSHVFNSASL